MRKQKRRGLEWNSILSDIDMDEELKKLKMQFWNLFLFRFFFAFFRFFLGFVFSRVSLFSFFFFFLFFPLCSQLLLLFFVLLPFFFFFFFFFVFVSCFSFLFQVFFLLFRFTGFSSLEFSFLFSRRKHAHGKVQERSERGPERVGEAQRSGRSKKGPCSLGLGLRFEGARF